MASYTVEVRAQNNIIEVTIGNAIIQTSVTSGYKNFTSIEAQTAFELNDTPITHSAIVDINGVIQHEIEDFIVSGSFIVMNTGLIAGDKVGVRYAKN